MKVLGYPADTTAAMQVYADWCGACNLEMSGWCGGCETCDTIATYPLDHNCAQGESSPYPKEKQTVTKTRTLEQALLLDRLNNGPQIVDGEPLTYKQQLRNYKAEAIAGETIDETIERVTREQRG